MKQLLVIRHAKSSWDNPDLVDHERPLNKRGLEDAPLMGSILKKKNLKIDKIFSSDALRAKQTIEMIAEEINFDQKSIEFTSELYHASRKELVQFLKNINDHFSTITIVGHNPGLTDLVHFLLEDFGEDLPTCAIVLIELKINSWTEVHANCGELKSFEFPKKYRTLY